MAAYFRVTTLDSARGNVIVKPARWDEHLVLGFEALDREHHLQIELVHELLDATERHDWGRAHELLDRLVDATSVHFMGEEILMRERAYPGYQAHVKEHNELMSRVTRLRVALENAKSGSSLVLIDEIRDWLSGHIDSMDRPFGRFLAEAPKSA